MRCFIALLVMAVLSVASPAADAPRKEPVYAGKPTYCRLAFGRDKAIVWLALDGDKLYADQNANGDLTDDEPATVQADGSGDTAWRTFRVNELRVAGRTHRALMLTVMALKAAGSDVPAIKDLLARKPDARYYRLSLDIEMPGRTGTGLGSRVAHFAGHYDHRGVLQFADRPADAPLIRFDGPLTLAVSEPSSLTASRGADLMIEVGCVGEGPGTFASVAYEGVIPKDTYPVVEATYPAKEAGGAPVRERYELKQRC
ncbi:MAG: hypothetical protein U0746_06440 [Gemmataceae bacterium]